MSPIGDSNLGCVQGKLLSNPRRIYRWNLLAEALCTRSSWLNHLLLTTGELGQFIDDVLVMMSWNDVAQCNDGTCSSIKLLLLLLLLLLKYNYFLRAILNKNC